MTFERAAIVVLLIGFATFGLLRTRFAVGTTFDVRPGARLLGAASVVAVLAVLFFASRTAAGAIVAGLLLGGLLYAGYRLRQAR
ncbi:MAG TPA: hypothetical protein VF029_04540 [Actinomycetota bacterium]